MSSKSHVCFCTLCKGQSQSSRYKIQQHAKLYGLWDPKRAKRSRIDESDSSASETSDGEMEEWYVEAGIEEDDFCDNLSANCDDNGSWQEPLPSATDQDKLVSAKVSNTFEPIELKGIFPWYSRICSTRKSNRSPLILRRSEETYVKKTI